LCAKTPFPPFPFPGSTGLSVIHGQRVDLLPHLVNLLE
jgi:hypothetical protein